jgi:beta-glucanase (GH16 family)
MSMMGCMGLRSTSSEVPIPTVSATASTVVSTCLASTSTVISTCRAATSTKVSTSTVSAARWRLVWSDEFNGPSINRMNWGFEHGFVRNHEAQFYTERPENARIENGNLVIEARRENYQGAAYTSASLLTSGKHSWKYGYFEIRAKIPTDSGSWPAWWALGDGGWPKCGEIDMMEYYRNMLLSNVMDSERHWSSHRDPLPQDFQNSYHTWAMAWDANTIKLFRDGVLMLAYDVNKATVGNYNPFRQPLYLILNLAIGGNNGGDPSKTTFPLRYSIDYVRVYQWY